MKINLRSLALGAAIGTLACLLALPSVAAAATAEATRGSIHAIAPQVSTAPTGPPNAVIQDRAIQWARSYAAGTPTGTTNFVTLPETGATATIHGLTTEAEHQCFGFTLDLTWPAKVINGRSGHAKKTTTPASVLVLSPATQPATYEYFVGNTECEAAH